MLNKSIHDLIRTCIFIVMGRKGGITKTTIAVNLALFLARMFGLRVLLIETDGQGDATDSVGLPYADAFHELINNNAEWVDVIEQVPEEFAGPGVDLWILRAFDAQLQVERNQDTPSILFDRLKELDGIYDVIVIDTGPNFAETHVGLYYAPTSGGSNIILPTTIEKKAIKSLERMFGYLEQARNVAPMHVNADGEMVKMRTANMLAIQPNMFDGNRRIQHHLTGWIYGRYEQRTTVLKPMRYLQIWEHASIHSRSVLDFTGRYATTARHEFMPLVNLAYEAYARENPHMLEVTKDAV